MAAPASRATIRIALSPMGWNQLIFPLLRQAVTSGMVNEGSMNDLALPK
ncbi:MAG TPA: hypothetical protein VNM72_09600 [Blastocatellia bacterium]|nr:hypothetical protein [Blastocatellia bacterium]